MADTGPNITQTVYNIAEVGVIAVNPAQQLGTQDTPAGDQDTGLARLLQNVRNNVLEKCEGDVRTPFRSLSTPEHEEYPELTRFQFYKGSDNHDVYTTNRGRYMDRNYGERQRLDVSQLHEGGNRYVMLISPVGTGKSTLVKRYCRKVLNGEIPALRDVCCVIFLLFQDIDPLADKFPKDFFFDSIEGLSSHEKHRLFEWLRYNSRKLLVAIDGLDQAQFSLDCHLPATDHDSKANLKNIVCSLFSGAIFPECYILSSSREHAAISMPSEIRPNSTVALAGLPPHSIESLIKAFGGRHGERIWRDITSKAASLVSLCQTPLFLILTTAIYKENLDHPPDTMSGLMIQVMLNFIHTDFAQEQKPYQLLKKLMKLALYGTQNSKVTFSSHDLADFDIPTRDVKDLFVMAPRKTRRIVHQRLLDGDVSFFFCHLSFQETLSALRIVQLDLDDFTHFVNGELYNPHWIVVRRVLCGSMLHPDTFETMKELILNEGEDQTQLQQKVHILRESIRKELTSPTVSVKLSMFAILQECGNGIDEMIKRHITEVRLYYKILTKADMQCVVSVCRRLDSLEYASMSFCNLNEETLSSFEEAMRPSPTKIKRLDIPYNTYLGEAGCRVLGKIIGLCRVDDLVMRNCQLKVSELRGLKESLVNAGRKLPILDLCQNKLEHLHILELIGLASQISDEIWVTREDIQSADLEILMQGVADMIPSHLRLRVDTTD